jgi:hypothetical protein
VNSGRVGVSRGRGVVRSPFVEVVVVLRQERYASLRQIDRSAAARNENLGHRNFGFLTLIE